MQGQIKLGEIERLRVNINDTLDDYLQCLQLRLEESEARGIVEAQSLLLNS